MRTVLVSLLVSSMLVTSLASAQDRSPDDPGEEEEEVEDEKRSVMDRDMDLRPRFRSGTSFTYGPFLPGPVHMFGVEGRIGAQITDLIGVYSASGGMLGFHQDVTSEDGDLSFERSFGGAIFSALMFEVTFVDHIYLALGPQVLWGVFVHRDAYVDTTQEEAGGSVSVFIGPMGGLKTRLGFGFGSSDLYRRKQFTFGVDANLIFGQRYVADANASGNGITVGADDGIAVGFMPSVFLGYDAK